MTTDYDAVIVGAGPAGSTAAYLLAQRGWRVLLVERSPWPREKACGGCLNAAGVQLLHGIGLSSVLAAFPRLTRMRLLHATRSLAFNLPPGIVVDRPSFDARVVSAAIAAGTTFLPETTARLQPAISPESRTLLLEHRGTTSTIHTRLVLACDGLAKPHQGLLAAESWANVSTAPAPRLGFALSLPAETALNIPDETLLMCLGNAGYVGLVTTQSAGTHIGAALLPQACHSAGGPLPVIQQILLDNGISNFKTPAATHITGTGPLTTHREIVGHGRVLALGDAAGYVEPFTGEGISWALRAATAAAQLCPHHPATIPNTLGNHWNTHSATTLRPRQIWCRSLRTLMANPTATRIAMQAAYWMPSAAALLARKISA